MVDTELSCIIRRIPALSTYKFLSENFEYAPWIDGVSGGREIVTISRRFIVEKISQVRGAAAD